jgi:ABC-type glycerol-3-phosphate transport system substrate-binding protein
MKTFRLSMAMLALALGAAACGPSDAPMKGSDPSPGAKGPGPVDRGGGSSQGSTVGESQNRDTKSGGATSGAK